ncbi:MAG TPA: transcriptional regulator [Streptosporangiaceae bacterium]
MTNGQHPPLELTIGVVGSHDLVEQIMLSGTAIPAPAAGPAGAAPGPGGNGQAAGGYSTAPAVARRLVAVAYRTEPEAGDKVLRLGPGIDVWLFASRIPYLYARQAGVLRKPATYVPLGGSALYAALLRAAMLGDHDLSRLSVDVLSRAEVEDAFADMGLAVSDVHVREEPGGAAALAAFHERLWRRHQTAVAVTCLESVAQRLTALDIPVLVVRPTRSAIASALRTATLLGTQRRLEDAQLAVAVVEVPTLRETSRRSPRQPREELRLVVHRLLLQEAQRIKATLSPAGEDSFLVTATRGSLSGATDGFRVPPFAERARTELGIVLEVGVGLGLTAQDAEAHARAVLARAHADAGARGFALDREGHALLPGPREPIVVRAGNPRGMATLSRLTNQLPEDAGPHVVDAETAGRLLGVTSRTARRLLRTLAEEGLAWPLPPNRLPQPGRPRQLYRLVTEKLSTDTG